MDCVFDGVINIRHVYNVVCKHQWRLTNHRWSPVWPVQFLVSLQKGSHAWASPGRRLLATATMTHRMIAAETTSLPLTTNYWHCLMASRDWWILGQSVTETFYYKHTHTTQCNNGNNNVLSSTTVWKGKVLPYSLLSAGHGANPGVQAVSPQVTF